MALGASAITPEVSFAQGQPVAICPSGLASCLYTHITTATTTAIKSGPGVLHLISVNTGAAGTATLYDNTAGSGTVIGIIDTTAAKDVLLDVGFATGLTIVTAGTSDITVSYK